MSIKPSEYQPDYAVPPGRTIQETLECIGCTVNEFAELSGWTTTFVEKLISGEVEIDGLTAAWLDFKLGPPKQFWLNLEANYTATLKRLGQERPSHDRL